MRITFNRSTFNILRALSSKTHKPLHSFVDEALAQYLENNKDMINFLLSDDNDKTTLYKAME